MPPNLSGIQRFLSCCLGPFPSKLYLRPHQHFGAKVALTENVNDMPNGLRVLNPVVRVVFECGT